MTHELKTNHEYFVQAINGKKTFTVRKADRDFKVGDIIRKIDNDLNAFADFEITYILTGGEFGIASNYVVMSLQKCDSQINDNVNYPSHYTTGNIECIDYIEDKELGFHLGNAVKYITRAGRKDPNKMKEDLKKAKWYLDRYIRHHFAD